ncbi:MAG: FliM/FliN family flagellar motor switch protein [Roseovarius sp.]|nr:FliM/FliN family flagellar motor switch protein [Roseovarius sp.]
MSPARALRLAVERSGDRIIGLAVTVRAVEQRRLPHAELADAVDADDLIVLLDGPGGSRGAAVFDRPFVQALIEAQTTGRVRHAPPPERPFTSTDAAMTAPLISAVMGLFAEPLADPGTGASAETRADTRPRPDSQSGGFRFGDRVADARALALAIGSHDLDCFRLTAAIGEGAIVGTLTVILPPEASAPPDTADADARNAFDLTAAALGAPVTLDAVLARIRLPLSEVCALEPGMVLPVSAAAIGHTELIAAGGHVAARGRLGQMHGFRALRLTDPATAEGRGDDDRRGTDVSEDAEPATTDGTDAGLAAAPPNRSASPDPAGVPATEKS